MKKNMDLNERVGRGILDKNIFKINFDSRKSFVGVGRGGRCTLKKTTKNYNSIKRKSRLVLDCCLSRGGTFSTGALTIMVWTGKTKNVFCHKKFNESSRRKVSRGYHRRYRH